MCGTNKICHPEFKIILPCGCCPCKYVIDFDDSRLQTTSVAEIMKLAKSSGHRLHLLPNSTPGEGPIKISFEKLPEQTPKDQLNRTRSKNSSRNPKKITKRATTQSERTAARKVKRRQLQEDEIAAKRANNTPNSLPSPTTIQSKNSDAQVAVATYVAGTYVGTFVTGIETLQANPKVINQNKRSKTHFRKTKKTGRV